ncbi:MAG: hypothetical protein ACHQO8_00950 [Vicinamibacterales bacterium]
MAESTPLTGRGPQIFMGVGLLMLLLAAYIAGGDALTCCRRGASVDCDVTRTRLFGRVTVERVTATDIAETYVRTSTTQGGTIEPPDSGLAGKTTTNDNLVVKTRAGRQIDLVGGEASGQLAWDIDKLLKDPAGGPVTFYDSFNVIAGAIAAFGVVFVAFGAIAMRRA